MISDFIWYYKSSDACLSVYLSIYLSVCLSVCMSVCLSVCVCLCVCMSARPSICDYSPCIPWPHFQFLNFYTACRTPWTGDQPVASLLPTHRTTQTQNKRAQTSMPRAGFKLMAPSFEWAKTVHALDCVTTVFGSGLEIHIYAISTINCVEASFVIYTHQITLS
jgi:hypothetical protein